MTLSNSIMNTNVLPCIQGIIKKYGYTTLHTHMPANHKHMHERKGWNIDTFMNQAELIGPSTKIFIGRILSSKVFPEQTFNSCLGIFRLGKQYGNDRLEAACSEPKNHLMQTTASSRIF